MKSILALLFVCLAAVSAVNPLQFKRDIMIQTINAKQNQWVAGVNERFATDFDFSKAKRLLGAKKGGPELPIKSHAVGAVKALPATFDARQQWPNCKTMTEVRDQSDCGSCYAFGGVEAASDRICVETGKYVHLSAADIMSCCWSCGDGCNGGYPSAVMSQLASTGVVSGGNYEQYNLCLAYPFPICDHHVNGTYQNCDNLNGGNEFTAPACTQSCDSNSTYPTPYAQDLHKFTNAYSVAADVTSIMTEIYTNGPVEAAFDVYADFPTYKSGVYSHTTGQYLGGHAIKIIGWGTENSVDYWLIANSWNVQWGAEGFFKIKRGSDECGIESGVVAASGYVSK